MTASPRSTMSPPIQWVVWFGLGAGDAVLAGIGGLVPVIVLVGAGIVVGARADPGAAVSGLLMGFGLTWLALMGRQAASGGRLDDASPWFALGIVALAIGSVVGSWRIAARFHATDH